MVTCARASCRHAEKAHLHYRRGRDCGLCDCRRFRRRWLPAVTAMAWLERRNACEFCGRRGITAATPGGLLHCYRDTCLRLADGP